MVGWYPIIIRKGCRNITVAPDLQYSLLRGTGVELEDSISSAAEAFFALTARGVANPKKYF
jgi:hypothetical protein